MEVIQCKTFEQIHEVLTYCAGDLYNKKLNNKEFIRDISNKYYKNGVVFESTVEDQIAGMIAFYCNNIIDKKAFLSMIVVKVEYQGKGVGDALLNQMEKECSRSGMRNVVLEVDSTNKNAQGFYLVHGYQIIKKSEGSLFMEKCLVEIPERIAEAK